MTSETERPRFVLAVLCAALGAASVYEMTAPPPSYAVPAARMRSTVAIGAPAAEFMPPPANAFAAVTERPLFDPARKKYVPPPSAASGKAAPPPPPNLLLVGVIIDSERRLALMKGSEAALAMSYAVGERIDGWQVAEVDPDRVVLRTGTVEDDIRMDANKPPAGQAAPPMMATPSTGREMADQTPQQQSTAH